VVKTENGGALHYAKRMDIRQNTWALRLSFGKLHCMVQQHSYGCIGKVTVGQNQKLCKGKRMVRQPKSQQNCACIASAPACDNTNTAHSAQQRSGMCAAATVTTVSLLSPDTALSKDWGAAPTLASLYTS
jgi:hypothetical protein